jgi:enoyl-CoA hydratase
MEFNTIAFESPEAGIGLITLSRPERLNAISLDMLEELHALMERLADDESVRVVVLTGKGRGFCSGADLLDERILRDKADAFANAAVHLAQIQKKYARLIVEMRRLPQPIIAAVNGPAAGGGMCMALAADIVIAGTGASFIASFINIGLSGGELGSTYFLPRLVGAARAAEILMTGRTVGSEEADRIGLVSRRVPTRELLPSALDTARRLVGKSLYGLRLTKETLVQNQNAPSLEAAVELENRNQSLLCVTPDFFEAVAEFGRRKSES